MRDTLTSPRVEDMKRKRRAYRIRLSILVCILVISFIGALAYFSSYSRVTLHSIVVSGTHIINPSNIESLVKEDISGKYIYLFTKANSLIYPKKKIYNNILNRFPRIDKLSIYRDNLTTLHIEISERSGSYLYCGATVPEVESEIGENCYFINDDGYVFDRAPYFSGNVYFKYYLTLPEGNYNNPLGLQILPPERFHSLAQFIDGVTTLGFKPTYVILDGDGNGELFLNNKEGTSSPKIMFKNNDTIITMLDNLSVSMGKPEFANEIKSKYTTLLYIDLRFNNKVVYKFQE